MKIPRIIAGLLSAAVMLGMAAALNDFAVAFALGVAVFIALGGRSPRRGC
ncbi:hypothetical protein [Hyphococcus luteus]|nr:hypothetical protein [Marinicaulis flavus]